MPAVVHLVIGVELPPRTPPLAERLKPDGSAAPPVRCDHVEARRRARERPLRAQGHLSNGHGRRAGECGRGCRKKRGEYGESQLHRQGQGCQTYFAITIARPRPDTIFTTVRALLAALGVGLVLASVAAGGTAQPRVLAIQFGPDLEVNPVTQDYLTGKLDDAAKGGYDAAVILLDTPGGLSTSMKKIYTAELNAKLPVIVYVAPDGARAASAGVWIAQAADVLAMAPTTNIGSSTPIDSSGGNLGSDLRRKVINDAAASLTALAATHHRNTRWPALAVRKASNLTAEQALDMNVIDVTAPTLPTLLNKLDGYHTKDAQRPYTLHLAGAQIDNVKPGL